MIRMVIAVMTTLALLAGGAYAFGGGNHGATAGPSMGQMPMGGMMRGGMGGGGMAGMMGAGAGAERPLLSLALERREELGLSAEQVKALEAARGAFEKEAIRRHADIEIAERELAELLHEPTVDLSQVEAKVREIARVRADLRLARIKTLEKGKGILTADQRTKLQSSASRAGGMMGGQGMTETMRGSDGRHGGMSRRGVEEMHRFMSSEQAPQAMAAMMEMARRMGDGDTMLGMVRMMEMMGGMDGTMGGGMMGSPPHHDMPGGMKGDPKPEDGSRGPKRE